MRFAPRTNVRVQLALAILIAIILSWILSGGLSNYIGYLHVKAIRQEMLQNPQTYPVAIPAQTFGVREFFLGPQRPSHGPPPFDSRDRMRPKKPPFANIGDMNAKRPMMSQGPDKPGNIADITHGDRMDSPDRGHEPRDIHAPPSVEIELKLALARLVIAVILAFMIGKYLSTRFTKPLLELSAGASAYHSGNFEYRIPTNGGDEFSDVARAMNEMASRVSVQIGSLEEDAIKRRQFLADAAHELRSPVTTMRTMAGALAEGLASDPQRTARATEALVRTSERLLRLVTDLMELAKLDLKELPLRLVDVDLSNLVTANVQAHMEEARSAGMTLRISEPLPSAVASVDPDRISQVLDNLLNNAISYAGTGTAIDVSMVDGDPVHITIADNGKGIPASHTQRVFDPFYRVDAARNPMDSHSGLGLRITKGIVEAHGGEIKLISTEGKGTTVVIALPKEHHK